MRKCWLTYSVILASLGIPGAAAAQGGATAPASGELSPGNQVIAKSLFEAQAARAVPAVGKTGGKWSLAKISAARAGGKGWSEIFSEMKAQGLLDAATVAEILHRYHPPAALRPSLPPRPPRRPMVITTGTNSVSFVPRTRFPAWRVATPGAADAKPVPAGLQRPDS